MSRYAFKLPDVGEGTAEAEIVAWRVSVGDVIEEDDPLVDVMTDKATVEMTSPVSGKVAALHGEPGDMAAVGSIIAEFETETEQSGAAPPADVEQAPSEAVADAPAPAAKPRIRAASGAVWSEEAVLAAMNEGVSAPSQQVARSAPREPEIKERNVLAAPAVRARAQKLGLDLAAISGSGPEGRITHDDLDRVLAPARHGAPALAQRNGIEPVKVIGLRRKIAEKMAEAKRRIPHFAYVEEVDLTELEELRAHLNATRQPDQPKLTILPFLMRALALATPDFPQINARFDDEQGVIYRHENVDIGIATQTENGLIVPVARHVEARDIWDCALEAARLAAAARANTATKEELSGSTITISSLGALGGVAATPVINHPEVAIVGVNKLVERPVVKNGAIVIRKMMNLSSSFDHRVVDGYDAAAFIQRVKDTLEHPARLFIAR